jgi:ketopantoate hydroxymethyltransferase
MSRNPYNARARVRGKDISPYTIEVYGEYPNDYVRTYLLYTATREEAIREAINTFTQEVRDMEFMEKGKGSR